MIQPLHYEKNVGKTLPALTHIRCRLPRTRKIVFLMSILALFCRPDAVKAQGVPELMYFRFDVPGPTVPNQAATATAVSLNGTLAASTIGGVGQFGTALQGNGSTANLFDAGWATNLSGPWTMSMWFSGVNNTLASNYLFGASGGSTFRAMTGSGLVSGAGNLLIRGTGLTDIPVNGIFNATGTPVVVTVVYDPTIPGTQVYVNGVFNSTVTQSAALTLTGTNFTIGNYANSTSLPTGGGMDEFRLYNRALTATEITATWNQPLPLTPCAGPPTAGTATAAPAVPCYGAPSTLYLTGSTSASGLTYAWESNNGAGWLRIAGATNSSYVIASATGNTQYRAWVKCGNDSTVSTTVVINASPLVPPYTETFESIAADNQLPNCMTATNFASNTRTYIANQANATNHTPGGSKFGAFYYSPAGTNAFFTPAFSLVAGTSYLVRFWYRGAANAATFTSFGAYYGTTNTVAGMTNLINTVNPTSTTYQEFVETFTPATTGVYYIGIMGTHTATLANTYVSIDDIGVTALTPCTGRPDAGTISPATPCANQNFLLSRVGGTSSTAFGNLTFQWQDSTATNSWQNSPGISTNATYTGNIAAATKFRVIVTCTNSGLRDTSAVYLVRLASFLTCYCVPTYIDGGGTDNITNVVLKNLANNTASAGNPFPYYVNYTSQQPGALPIPNLVMGETDTVKITFGTDGTQYSAVWIDFDHSGYFELNEYFSSAMVGASATVRIPFTTPLTAEPGLTRMRIRGGDDAQPGSMQPCNASNSTFGEGEDYLVNVVFPPCTGPLNAGSTIITDTAICRGYAIDLYNTTHEYRMSQISWSWEESAGASGIWRSVANSQNVDTLRNIVITGPVSYRLKMICAATGDSTYSVPVSVRIKAPYQCYCYSQSDGGAADMSDVGAVTIGSLINSTGGPHLLNPVAIRRRTDYTDIPNIILHANNTYHLSLYHTQPNYSHEDALITVFVDYNNDLVYNTSAQPDGERIFSGVTTAGNFYLDTVIRIPDAVVPNVPTGLRIILNNDLNPNSPANLGCGPYVSGETEDYVVMFRRIPQSVPGVQALEYVSLYPNPATGKFTVSVGAQQQIGALDVSISSITGQQMMHKVFAGVGSHFKQEIDLGEVARGIYFVTIKTATGDKRVQKLILR